MDTPFSRSWRPWVRDVAGAALFRVGLTAPRWRGQGRLTIVTFHRVLPVALRETFPTPGLAVLPDELDWFLGFFAHHFECVRMTEGVARILDGAKPEGGKPLLAITFDDGQRDNFDWARPVLQRHGVPATFYVVAGSIGASDPLWYDLVAHAYAADAVHVRAVLAPVVGGVTSLDGMVAVLKRLDADTVDDAATGLRDSLSRRLGTGWLPTWDGFMEVAQLTQLLAEGHEVGCHSMRHAILPHTSDDRLRVETADARVRLQERLGHPVTSFCYPNGDRDARVERAVRDAGFDHAVTTRFGRVQPGADRMNLPRCDMQSETARGAHGRLSRSRVAWRISGLHPGLG